MSYSEIEEVIRGLLLNSSLIFLPLFFYESLVLDKKGHRSKKITQLELSLLVSISIVLAMTFPIPLFDGHIFDLRLIALLIAGFYGGKQSLSISFAIMLIYRLYLPGDGLYTTIVVYTTIFLVSLYLVPKYKEFNRKKKIAAGIYMSTVAFTIKFISTFIVNMHKVDFYLFGLINFFVIYYISSLVVLYVTINLMEGFIEKNDLRTELQRAERLNSVGELAASLAHEVRNPLTAAKGFLQLLDLYPNLSTEKQKEYLETAVNEIDRAESVIGDFLALAKPAIEKEEVINVSSLIESVCNVMSSYALMEDIYINKSLEAGCYVYTDRNKLTQVLINIIKNGIEATEPGGYIMLKNYKIHKDIIIEITDTGKGMTKEETSRLGTPFYSLKTKGTGLGLMISYRFIEVIGGRIRVHSEKGEGTTFKIEIPYGRKFG